MFKILKYTKDSDTEHLTGQLKKVNAPMSILSIWQKINIEPLYPKKDTAALAFPTSPQ